MNKVIFLVLSLAVVGYGEIISNLQCTVGRDANNILSEVHEIRVSPCAEADDGEACVLRKGSSAVIEVDFTPTRSVRRLKTGMWWMSKVDMPFRGMSQNACRFMTCPIVAGTRYTYNATINLQRSLPGGLYPIKLKIYEGKNNIICQTLKIRLTDPE